MRYILMLSAVFFFSLASYGQKTDTTLFKGATKVIIETQRKTDEIYRSLGAAFIETEIGIGTKDQEFGQIVSGRFKLKGGPWVGRGDFIMKSFIKGSKVVLSIDYNNGADLKVIDFGTKSTFRPVAYKRYDDQSTAAFDKMLAVAKLVGYEKLTYSE